METYIFYFTHLIMITCFIVIISMGWEEHKPIVIKNMVVIIGGISPIKKLKTTYRTFDKEKFCFKLLIISLLNSGIQMYSQLFK
jgi:hypothetical protein